MNREAMSLRSEHIWTELIKVRKPDDFWTRVCDLALDSLQMDLIWIGIPAGDSVEVLPAASAGDAAAYLDEIRVTWDNTPTGQGPTGRAISSGEVQVENDIARSDVFAPWREAALDRGLASSAALPVKLDNRVVAVLNLYSSRKGLFSAEKLEELSVLCNQISINLQRIQSEKMIQQKADELSIINNIALMFNSTLDFDDLLKGLAAELRRIIPLDRAGITLLDFFGKHVVLTASVGSDISIQRVSYPLDTQLALDGVVESRRPFFRPRVSREKAQMRDDQAAWENGLGSYLQTPLISRDRVIGILSLGSFKPDQYDDALLEIVSPVAEQLAKPFPGDIKYTHQRGKLRVLFHGLRPSSDCAPGDAKGDHRDHQPV